MLEQQLSGLSDRRAQQDCQIVYVELMLQFLMNSGFPHSMTVLQPSWIMQITPDQK